MGNSVYTNVASAILSQIQKNSIDAKLLATSSSPSSPSSPPVKGYRIDMTTVFSVYRIEDIARQITLTDWELFNQLRLQEFHDTAWMKPTRNKTAPHSIFPPSLPPFPK